MINDYMAWIIIFFIVIGVIHFIKDISRCFIFCLVRLCRVLKRLYSKHPIKKWRCKRLCKKYRSDFYTLDALYNSDYSEIRRYILRNRKGRGV